MRTPDLRKLVVVKPRFRIWNSYQDGNPFIFLEPRNREARIHFGEFEGWRIVHQPRGPLDLR